MATIKSYTDIEQSRKLAEMLPLRSADMWYQHTGFNIKDGSEKPIYFPMIIRDCESDKDILCWSLSALLNVIPCGQVNKMANSGKWEASSWDNSFFEPPYYVENYDNPVDACYDLILKLNELKIL